MEQIDVGGLKRRRNVADVLVKANRLKNTWSKFMKEFYRLSFDADELDDVLSHLKKLHDQDEKNRRIDEEMSEDNNLSKLEKKVFGNHLLSSSIFKWLSIRELIPCRLVNTHWNKIVSEVIIARGMTFSFVTKKNRFYLSGKNELFGRKKTWRSLDMFTELLRSSKNFPCTRFIFDQGNLGNDDAQRFFSLFAPSITYLNLSLGYNEGEVWDKRGRGSWDDDSGFSGEATDIDEIGKILLKAPKIKELDFDLRCSVRDYWLLSSGRFELTEAVNLPHLTRLTCESEYDEADDLLIWLLNGAKNLKSLQLEGENTLKILSKLAQSCEKSIERIGIFKNEEVILEGNFPVFEKVQHLDLCVLKESEYGKKEKSFLAKGSSFTVNFPKLTSVSFQFEKENESSGVWEKHFPVAEKLPLVDTVMINYGSAFPPSWTNKLMEMLPNLKNLIVFEINSFLSFALAIWKFHKALPALKIGKKFSSPTDYYPVLDANTKVDADGSFLASYSDFEFIWQNFVENSEHPLITELKGNWKQSLQTLGPSGVQKVSSITYGLHDFSTLTLTKVMVSRGMTWEDVLAKHAQLKAEEEGGFYVKQHDFMGRGKKKDTVVRSVQTVVLVVKKAGQGTNPHFICYRPNLGQSRPTIVRPQGKKVSAAEAEFLWKNQFNRTGAPNLECSHLYIEGKCAIRSKGGHCDVDARQLTYHILSGSVLKVWKTVEECLMDPSQSYYNFSSKYKLVRELKFCRVVDEIDPVMGILVPKSILDKLKQSLQTLANTTNEIVY